MNLVSPGNPGLSVVLKLLVFHRKHKQDTRGKDFLCFSQPNPSFLSILPHSCSLMGHDWHFLSSIVPVEYDQRILTQIGKNLSYLNLAYHLKLICPYHTMCHLLNLLIGEDKDVS